MHFFIEQAGMNYRKKPIINGYGNKSRKRERERKKFIIIIIIYWMD